MQKKLETKAIPFRGGLNTYLETALLEPGEYSMVQNFRQMHPGLKKRPGQIKLHTTADGTNRVMSLYQLSKGKIAEKHFYAQMSDGDVLEATAGPPTVTTGVFGAEVHNGTASGIIPASWSNFNDTLLYSNGSDQHQIYYGQNGRVLKFIVYKGSGAIPDFPILGQDFTDQINDGLSTTVAVLDSLDTIANYHCAFICVPVPINKLTWTVAAENGTASVSILNYRKNDNTWAACASFADNTSADSKSMSASGTMTCTKPTDSIPTYMFGAYGYWYQWGLSSGALDSEVEVSAVTFESDWNSIENLWDGVLVDGIEAQLYVAASTKYQTFSTSSIDLNAMATADYLYIAFSDPQQAVYLDAGDVPSTTANNTVDGFDYWNGTAWATIGSFTDHSVGVTQAGFIIIPNIAAGLEQPLSFNNTQYYAYWYRLSVNKALSTTVNIGIMGIPKYSISDFGQKGICNAVWRNRAVYVFDQNPNFINIAAEGNPQVLNGDDYDIKKAGDGRSNKIVCMKPFFNELMVFQEEKGVEGGTISLFDGYSPDTFGSVRLSSRYGTMNSQSVDVVDGFNFGEKDKEFGLTAFILSRYGVLYTDGKLVRHVPNFEKIRNYFDPTNASSIRAGYESHMWLKYDSAFNILRIGLVTGSGTVCNTFLTYDLTDLSWGVDSYTQELSAYTECESASGTAPVIQVGGGVDDGQVYLLNSGTNDVTTAIDSYVTIEFDNGGNDLTMDELMVRMKSQASGTITVTPYINAIAKTAFTFDQTAEITNQTIRRHKKSLGLEGQHISLKIQHNTASESCYLEDLKPKFREISER
jgi:hypothetical protein